MINEFRGKYFFLSNFSSSVIEYDGLTFLNGEAAFQAQKANTARIKENFCNLPPNEAKSKGRHVTLRSHWEDVKENIMRDIIRCKFMQNKDLKEKLLATGEEELVEGNTWGDTCWGVCRSKGDNKLGKILMGIRKELSA